MFLPHKSIGQKSSPLVIDLFSLFLLFSGYELNMTAVALIGLGVIFNLIVRHLMSFQHVLIGKASGI